MIDGVSGSENQQWQSENNQTAVKAPNDWIIAILFLLTTKQRAFCWIANNKKKLKETKNFLFHALTLFSMSQRCLLSRDN
jgi:hypothetical protein